SARTNANKILVNQQIIRGVKAPPSVFWTKIGFDPGMAGTRSAPELFTFWQRLGADLLLVHRTVGHFLPLNRFLGHVLVEISSDITGWNPKLAQGCQHQMGKVLTHAAA